MTFHSALFIAFDVVVVVVVVIAIIVGLVIFPLLDGVELEPGIRGYLLGL